MTATEIKELRKSLKLSQEEFAYKMDVSVTTISRWERGKIIPHRSFQKKMEHIKGV